MLASAWVFCKHSKPIHTHTHTHTHALVLLVPEQWLLTVWQWSEMDATMLTGGVIILCPLVPGMGGQGHTSLSIRPPRCSSFPLCLANETFPPDCSPEITIGALANEQTVSKVTWKQRYTFTCKPCSTLSYKPNFTLVERVWSGRE